MRPATGVKFSGQNSGQVGMRFSSLVWVAAINLSHLTNDFLATAVDISGKMLAQCHRLNPDVPVHLGDMRTVRLGKRFKAVLIHDAITYMLTEADPRQTFATAAEHLEPGGVFVTAPDHFRETFHSPRVEHTTNSDGKTELTLIEYQYDGIDHILSHPNSRGDSRGTGSSRLGSVPTANLVGFDAGCWFFRREASISCPR